MKKKIFIFLSAVFIAGNAMALSFTGKVEFLNPLVLTQVQPLDIGKFSSSGAPGTANSGGTASGGVTILQPGNNAEFNVLGSAEQVVEIDVSDTSTFTNGTDDLTVSFFAPASVVLTGGTANFAVAAEVDVPGLISPGEYTGNYDVNVLYQ